MKEWWKTSRRAKSGGIQFDHDTLTIRVTRTKVKDLHVTPVSRWEMQTDLLVLCAAINKPRQFHLWLKIVCFLPFRSDMQHSVNNCILIILGFCRFHCIRNIFFHFFYKQSRTAYSLCSKEFRCLPMALGLRKVISNYWHNFVPYSVFILVHIAETLAWILLTIATQLSESCNIVEPPWLYKTSSGSLFLFSNVKTFVWTAR